MLSDSIACWYSSDGRVFVPQIVVRREGMLGWVCSVGVEEEEWWQYYRHNECGAGRVSYIISGLVFSTGQV